MPDEKLDAFIRVSPAGYFENGKSAYGCYDMAGNVLEWCADSIDKKYKAYRGGCFLSGEARLLRCAWRGGNYPETGHVYWGIIGFRVAMDALPDETLKNGN